MRIVIQRVKNASVKVDGQVVGAVEKGVMALVGMGKGDDIKTFEYMASKLINLRIFTDEFDKMNLSVSDIGGGILLVPNFTLYGDARHGRRPGYTLGAGPEEAKDKFESFVGFVKDNYQGTVESGIFQADMEVSLINDGPVTLLLDSDKNF